MCTLSITLSFFIYSDHIFQEQSLCTCGGYPLMCTLSSVLTFSHTPFDYTGGDGRHDSFPCVLVVNVNTNNGGAYKNNVLLHLTCHRG